MRDALHCRVAPINLCGFHVTEFAFSKASLLLNLALLIYPHLSLPASDDVLGSTGVLHPTRPESILCLLEKTSALSYVDVKPDLVPYADVRNSFNRVLEC